MANTYTTRAKLAKAGANDPAWNTTLNADFDALDALEAVGALAVRLAETPSTTLNVAVSAGDYPKADGTIVSYAGTSSFATTTARTNYLYLTDGGTLTEATSFPAGNIVTLAVVVTGATTITSITDKRRPYGSSGANLNTVYLPLAGGTLTGALTVSTGGFTVTAGGLLVTAGGLMVSAGTTAVAALTCTTLAPSSTITVADGQDVVLNTTTGTKIGTAVGQKLGFWNATPVVQQASANQAAAAALTSATLTDSTTGTGNTTVADVGASFTQATLNNNFADLVAQVNALRADLVARDTLLTAIRTALVNTGLMKGSA